MKNNEIMITIEVIIGTWLCYFIYSFIKHILFPVDYSGTSFPWYTGAWLYGHIALVIIVILLIVMFIRMKIMK